MIAEETLTILSQLVGKTISTTDAESLFVTLNNQNAFAPPAMIGGMIENLQLNYSAINNPANIEPVFSDILTRDRYTGYYIHAALRTLYLDFAMTRAGQPGQEDRNFLILGDYMNLSSVNDAIGRSTTNDVMATICGIYLDSMTRAGVVDWLYHRSMGDEITFIVLNTDEDKVMRGLKEAQRITFEFIDALGLENLRHKKYPDRMGTGLVTACVTLKSHMNHRLLKQQLDDEIQNVKKQRPARTSWFGFGKQGVDPDQYHNRASEQRVDKALHKYRHYRNAAQFSSDIDNKTTTRNPLNPAKSLLVGRAIAWPRDDRIEYLRKHHDNSKIMLRADIYNLGGLNSTFGHDGADQVKAHLIRILYSTIASHDVSEPKVFDCGGGIIDIVLNAMPNFQLHKLVQAIQSNIYYQILTHKVSDYANAYTLSFSGEGERELANLPHPRHENKGTGLVMATHLVETTRSLPEIIERVDKITHRTKMHDFTYLWTDETDRVFGLALNEPPEPIEIGLDRHHAGDHYLPFTDALRQYLREEDLPNIFERPVGQICEILFGTDMQAVLGFKKAVRMLQDNKVPDETIEQITSYQEMDARLRAENLPPLSVVSTQNRPALAHNEREGFKTMALAEKLEGLPKAMTALVLQAQACFRTLKIVMPHGQLSPQQAIQILLEEIDLIPQYQGATDAQSATEALYYLSRLLDRTHATLGKEMPEELRTALHDYALETLKDLARAFEAIQEKLLAQKIQTYVWEQADHPRDRLTCLTTIDDIATSMLEKMEKKHLVDTVQLTALQDRVEGLTAVLKNLAKTPDVMWAVNS